MNYQQALELLKSFDIKEGHDWDRHCIQVGAIANRLAQALKPFVDIDPDRVRLMGLVHDFGRSVTHCPYRHAYEGYKLMKELGEDHLARICACHSNGTYREEELPEYGLKPEDFFVTCLEEKLIFIADNLESHGRVVRQQERLEETIKRYRLSNPDFVPILESKFGEFKQFDQEIRQICGKSVYEILEI
ncbi:MAG: HD domain-containing protein [Clostridia bacterium]|nr:HD domain-containing protein [Clostridia bacterium]